MVTNRWFTLLILIATFQVVAQPYATRNISLEQGLPEFYVSGIVQDKAGFVWIATRNGLARYDGRTFKIFRHQPHAQHSLANNIIATLQLVSDSALLIRQEDGGFQLFNPITEQFADFLTKKRLEEEHLDVNNASVSPDERLLWGRKERNLMLFNAQQNKITVYPLPPLSLSENVFAGNNFLLDAQQKIYAPFPGGIQEFDTHTKQYRAWPHPLIGKQGAIDTYYGIPIVQRHNGEMLTIAPRQLIAFTPRTHRFRSIPIPDPSNTNVGVIHTAIDGNVYFTYAMTVYRMTPDDRITPLWKASRLDYRNYFHALLLDRSGVLWVGTNGDGIQQIDLRSLPVKSYPYQVNFFADLLSTELRIQVPVWAKPADAFYPLQLGGKASYVAGWIDKSYRLLRIDPVSRRLRQLVSMPERPYLSEEGNGICVMPNGHIWLYNPFRGLVKTDTLGRLLDIFPFPNERISHILLQGNRIWLGSETNGLYEYDPGKRRIVRQLRYQPTDSTSLISDHVLCMAVDPFDALVLWVGTQEGLYRLDTRTMRCQSLTGKEGLPDAVIQTIQPDREGNLWISTLKGISRLNPRTHRMRHFTIADGLQDIEYKHRHGVQLPNGQLAFGGATGMTVFDPLRLKEVPQSIPTVLTGLKINNLPVEPGQVNSPLQLPLNATKTLRLAYNQNFITFEFAGLQYNKPTGLTYRHQLMGVDEDWVYTGNQNVANYTQLAPGTYEFKVNTADAGGHWGASVKRLQIVVAPPWWRMWWAYLLYALILAGIIGYGIRSYLNRLRLQQTLALQQQKAEQLHLIGEMKSRFFANITHEFRTPLTLILTPAQRLKAALLQAEQRRWVMAIERNAYQLLELINQLMDLSKIDAQALKVDESRGYLGDFVAQLVESFADAAAAKRIELTYRSDLTGEYWFDAGKLERIVVNLVANALKFTPPTGQVSVTLQEAEGVVLTVSDTGTGIAAEKLPHIFERFYQADDSATREQEGTGIGLALVKELVDLQHGRIGVESTPGIGTIFTIRFPYRPVVESTGLSEQPASADREQPEEPAPDPEIIANEQPSLLIVEDNDELAGFIAESLPPQYRISRAANGANGLEQALELLPDLVISDVLMPVMDGYTLCQRLKEDERTNHIPVILLTAKSALDSRIEGLSRGADDYLTKPFHIQELQLRVHNLLERQRRFRERMQQELIEPVQIGQQPAPATPPDPFLQKLYLKVEERLDDSSLGVEDLAEGLNVSRVHLHRKVKALTGLSTGEVIRNYRLKRATHFLRENLNSSETAYRVGFDSPAYFSKCFRELYGKTPLEFAGQA